MSFHVVCSTLDSSSSDHRTFHCQPVSVFFTLVTSRQLLHVHVVVLAHVGGGGGEVVVDPHLVDREKEGQDVEGRGDPAVPRSLTVGVT